HTTGLRTGIVLVILKLLIIFGGLQWISAVAGVFVPMIAIRYIWASLVRIGVTYDQIIPALSFILNVAFSPLYAARRFAAGIVTEAIRQGVSKAIFSNEAGLGTVALIAGNDKTSHPVKQALVAMTGTFIVTIIVCTMTGLVLLVTGFWDASGGLISVVSHDPSLEAGALTSAAYGSSLGLIGEYIVSLS